MAVVSSSITRYRDLQKPTTIETLAHVLGMGDTRGDEFTIYVTRGSSLVDLTTASINAWFIRVEEGKKLEECSTVTIEGSVSDDKNAAYVLLPKACYVTPGRFILSVSVTMGSRTHVVYIAEGVVARTTTDTIVDPSRTIPDIKELLEQLNAMRSATTAANSATADATAAAKSANDAVKAAQTATTNANSATSAAKTATANADAATKSANDATAAAKTATANADAATRSANDAARTAQTVAAQWANVDVFVEMHETDYSPVCVVTNRDDGRTFTFKLPIGPTGLTPNFSIGTVTTGNPGTAAMVTIDGTKEDPILNFTIPQGLTGTIENLSVELTGDVTGRDSGSGSLVLRTEIQTISDDEIDEIAAM